MATDQTLSEIPESGRDYRDVHRAFLVFVAVLHILRSLRRDRGIPTISFAILSWPARAIKMGGAGGCAGCAFPSPDGIVSISAGAFKGAESDGMDDGTEGGGASPHKVTMPVLGSTDSKGSGGLEAEASTDKSISAGEARIRRPGASKKREVAAQFHVDEREPVAFEEHTAVQRVVEEPGALNASRRQGPGPPKDCVHPKIHRRGAGAIA